MLRFSTRLIALNSFLIVVIICIGSLSWIFGFFPSIDHIRYVIVILMYVSIATIVWQKAGQLNTYNLDRATIILIVCMGFIRTRLGIPNEIYYKAWIIGTAILILIGLIKYYKRIPKTNWRWAGIGLLFCVLIIPISIVEMIYPDRYSTAITDFQVGFEFVREIIYDLSFVSLMEEITFRSLVWGSFRQFGMKESSIIVVQGVAFWFMHLPRLIYPLSFLITIPVGVLIYSYLTYRSKQVFPSIILHTIFNAAGPIFVRLLLQ